MTRRSVKTCIYCRRRGKIGAELEIRGTRNGDVVACIDKADCNARYASRVEEDEKQGAEHDNGF